MDQRPSLRPFRAGFWFGGFNGLTWMIGLGTPMVLLAEQLGASALQVGLASSCVFLLLPVQVFATAALTRLGFKRQMVLGWLLRAAFLLVPLGLVWAAPRDPAPWMPNLLVASVFGFCLLRAFGSAAHIPWFAAILPVEIRGRFFATDSTITSIVGVLTLLLCAALFARLPPYEAFRIVYGLAMAGSLLAVVQLTRLPSAPAPEPVRLAALPGEARRLCLAPGLFRTYLGLTLLASLVTSSLQAFTVYYLKVEAGVASSQLLVLTAVFFSGVIAGSYAIRATIDQIPIRRLFQTAHGLIAGVDLFWLGLLSGAALLPVLPLAFFGLGLATGVSNAAHVTYLPELAPEKERPVAIAVFTAVLGLVAGAGPTLWGFVLKQPGAAPGVNAGRFTLFFALGAGLSALLLWLFQRLPDPRHGAALRP